MSVLVGIDLGEDAIIFPASTEAPIQSYKIFRGCEGTACYASSPFVTKVELRLRLAGVPYSVGGGAPWLGPKGKIPYCEITVENEPSTMLGDSALIVNHLVERQGIKDLNADLSCRDKSKDLGLRALLEDKLYFYHMRECWVDNYYAQRDQALSGVPLPVRFVLGQIVYRKVQRTLFGQGVGRYSDAEIAMFRNEIWVSFNDMLAFSLANHPDKAGAGPFWVLGGVEPTQADITLFGFISAILTGRSCPESTALLQSLPAIMDYAERIHHKYFADYTKWGRVDDDILLAEL